jgi:Methyltransferase domain
MIAQRSNQRIALGFAMAGLESRVIEYVEEICLQFHPVTYLEIGVGFGQTLTAIAAVMREIHPIGWRAIGVELPNGYSFDRFEVMKNAGDRGVQVNFQQIYSGKAQPESERVTVYLEDSHEFMAARWGEPIHLALIDGCHGKPCATQDFLNVEKFIPPGGIVLFHDFTQEQTGQLQPHCPTGCDVIGACRDLGLLDDKRAGWQFVETITADRAAGGWDMGVFRRSFVEPIPIESATVVRKDF